MMDAHDKDLEYDIVHSRWRVGRKLGRTVYSVRKSKPNDADDLLGVMETPAIAERVVSLHNIALAKEEMRLAASPEGYPVIPRYLLRSPYREPTRGPLDDHKPQSSGIQHLKVTRAGGILGLKRGVLDD